MRQRLGRETGRGSDPDGRRGPDQPQVVAGLGCSWPGRPRLGDGGFSAETERERFGDLEPDAEMSPWLHPRVYCLKYSFAVVSVVLGSMHQKLACGGAHDRTLISVELISHKL